MLVLAALIASLRARGPGSAVPASLVRDLYERAASAFPERRPIRRGTAPGLVSAVAALAFDDLPMPDLSGVDLVPIQGKVTLWDERRFHGTRELGAQTRGLGGIARDRSVTAAVGVAAIQNAAAARFAELSDDGIPVSEVAARLAITAFDRHLWLPFVRFHGREGIAAAMDTVPLPAARALVSAACADGHDWNTFSACSMTSEQQQIVLTTPSLPITVPTAVAMSLPVRAGWYDRPGTRAVPSVILDELGVRSCARNQFWQVLYSISADRPESTWQELADLADLVTEDLPDDQGPFRPFKNAAETIEHPLTSMLRYASQTDWAPATSAAAAAGLWAAAAAAGDKTLAVAVAGLDDLPDVLFEHIVATARHADIRAAIVTRRDRHDRTAELWPRDRSRKVRLARTSMALLGQVAGHDARALSPSELDETRDAALATTKQILGTSGRFFPQSLGAWAWIRHPELRTQLESSGVRAEDIADPICRWEAIGTLRWTALADLSATVFEHVDVVTADDLAAAFDATDELAATDLARGIATDPHATCEWAVQKFGVDALESFSTTPTGTSSDR